MADPIFSTTITRAATSYNRFLIDTSVNSRTGISRPVRLSKAAGRLWRAQGLPLYMRQPEWDLRFQNGDLVKKGDIETVTSSTGVLRGTFTVITIAGRATTPDTYSIGTSVQTIQTTDANGAINPIVYTDTVVFAADATNKSQLVSCSAYVGQLNGEDLTLFVIAPGVKYKCFFDTTVKYPDGSPVEAGDLIYVPWIESKNTGLTFDPLHPDKTNRALPINPVEKIAGAESWNMTTFGVSA